MDLIFFNKSKTAITTTTTTTLISVDTIEMNLVDFNDHVVAVVFYLVVNVNFFGPACFY